MRAIEDSQRDAKPERQDHSPEQVCLESNGQMSTILPHIEKVIQVDEQVLESLQRFEEIPSIPTITQPVQTR